MMTWNSLQEVTAVMPNLHHVEFGYNHLTMLDLSTPEQNTIQVLNLDSNECYDWLNICKALKSYKA